MRWWRRRRPDLSAVVTARITGPVEPGAFERMMRINMECDDLARVLAGLPSAL